MIHVNRMSGSGSLGKVCVECKRSVLPRSVGPNGGAEALSEALDSSASIVETTGKPDSSLC